MVNRKKIQIASGHLKKKAPSSMANAQKRLKTLYHMKITATAYIIRTTLEIQLIKNAENFSTKALAIEVVLFADL